MNRRFCCGVVAVKSIILVAEQVWKSNGLMSSIDMVVLSLLGKSSAGVSNRIQRGIESYSRRIGEFDESECEIEALVPKVRKVERAKTSFRSQNSLR